MKLCAEISKPSLPVNSPGIVRRPCFSLFLDQSQTQSEKAGHTHLGKPLTLEKPMCILDGSVHFTSFRADVRKCFPLSGRVLSDFLQRDGVYSICFGVGTNNLKIQHALIPIIIVGVKEKHREIKPLVQGHTARG